MEEDSGYPRHWNSEWNKKHWECCRLEGIKIVLVIRVRKLKPQTAEYAAISITFYHPTNAAYARAAEPRTE